MRSAPKTFVPAGDADINKRDAKRCETQRDARRKAGSRMRGGRVPDVLSLQLTFALSIALGGINFASGYFSARYSQRIELSCTLSPPS